MSRIALVAGSFDPITIGHYDLVMRSLPLFDEIWVTAFVNAEKKGLFTGEQKLALLRAAFGSFEQVHCDVSEELLADYAARHGITTLVKGARTGTDFDYEWTLYDINQTLVPTLDTVIFPAKKAYASVSSTMVRECIRYNKSIEGLVPAGCVDLIQSYLAEKA